MLFYDQNGVLGQFQGFNNSTHEYRINNIARNPISGAFNGSINFMIGGSSRFRVDPTVGTVVNGPLSVVGGAEAIGLFVDWSGSTAVSVRNTNASGTGIFADASSLGSLDTIGVFGSTDAGIGIAGIATDAVQGWAGYFDGDIGVTGTLFKGGGAFMIDHPLDPEHKYLSHSFVESPDMKNIYDGVVVLDESGEATVVLPDWFEALNRDFRYQLTPWAPLSCLTLSRKSLETGSRLAAASRAGKFHGKSPAFDTMHSQTRIASRSKK
jgi:hypothetical protein